MTTYSIHSLITIGNQTGLEFNFEGNTYKVSKIDSENRTSLQTLVNDNLPISYVDIEDDGRVFMRTDIDTDLTTVFCIFHVELNDDYMVSNERRLIQSQSSIQRLKDNILYAIRKVSIEHIGIHIVANWEDGGSDAVIEERIKTPDEFFEAYPTAISRDVFDFFAGIRDGIQVRTWIDDHNRVVCDTAYYFLDELTESSTEVSLSLSDDRHSIDMLLSVETIY